MISNVLKTVSLDGDDEQYDLVQYRVGSDSTSSNVSQGLVKFEWHYGIVARSDSVDVDELDEATAIGIMGALFDIHITDGRGICRT